MNYESECESNIRGEVSITCTSGNDHECERSCVPTTINYYEYESESDTILGDEFHIDLHGNGISSKTSTRDWL